MLVRYCSDLHMEFGYKDINYIIPYIDKDKDSILIISGDIGNIDYNILSNRFKYVLIILGNHDYYGKCLFNAAHHTKIKSLGINKYKNIILLDDTYIDIDGYRFIGSTLWTSCNNRDPIAMYYVSRGLNDYRFIKDINNKLIRVEDTIEQFYRSKEFIFNSINNKSIVITHNMPSEICVDPKYKGDTLNYGFYSELYNEIYNNKPLYWICGHTHTCFDGYIGETRVLINPYGYPYEDTKYNPNAIFDV